MIVKRLSGETARKRLSMKVSTGDVVLPRIVLTIATVVVLVVAAAATWFPARKAATVDPALALKAE